MLKKDTFLIRYLTKQAERKITEIESKITDQNREKLEKEIQEIKKDLEQSLSLVDTINEDSEDEKGQTFVKDDSLIHAFDRELVHFSSDTTFTVYERRLKDVLTVYKKFYDIADLEKHFYSQIIQVNPKDENFHDLGDTSSSNEISSNKDEISKNGPSGSKIYLPKYLYDYLLPFQIDSLQFFHKNQQNKSGSILADEMGLGKTVQVIAYLVSLLSDSRNDLSLDVIILSPVTLIAHWFNELRRCYPFFRVIILHSRFNNQTDELSDDEPLSDDQEISGSNIEDMNFIKNSYKKSAIYITSYETFKIDHLSIIKKYFSKNNRNFVVVLDEAHKIKNMNSLIYKSVKYFKEKIDPLFILTTGTPLQNNLIELFALFSFCNDILGNLTDYYNEIVRPIEREMREIIRSKKKVDPARLNYLKSLIRPYILRRLKKSHFFIKKREHILQCPMSFEQVKLYNDFTEKILRNSNINLLRGVNTLRRIVNHPLCVLQSNSEDEISEEMISDYSISSEDFPKNTDQSLESLIKASGKLSVIDHLLDTWLKPQDINNKLDIKKSQDITQNIKKSQDITQNMNNKQDITQ
ncbi:Transcription-coupled repair protein CSB/RAD26 (contains SNF2 family DNA-dependent ATPase domain), partial [Pseudoloma neurophilia]